MELFPRTRKLIRAEVEAQRLTNKLNRVQHERPERVARLISKGFPVEMLDDYSASGLVALEVAHERWKRGGSVYYYETGELSVGKYDMPEAEDEPADTTFAEE